MPIALRSIGAGEHALRESVNIRTISGLNGLMKRIFELLLAFLARDLSNRYRGSALGWLWYVLNPLLMLSVFTLVFSGIFRMRWGGGESSTFMFALNLFAGLLVHGFFSEAWQRGCQSVLSQPSLVKKVTFPLALLPIVVSLSSLAHCMLGLLVLFILVLLSGEAGGQPLYFLLSIPPMVLIAIGGAWIVAGLTVYIRDLAQVLGLGLTAMLFLAPVFYPMSQVPEKLQAWMLFNPVTIPAESLRATMLGGTPPPNEWFFWYWGAALVLPLLGLALFRFLSRGFADVL